MTNYLSARRGARMFVKKEKKEEEEKRKKRKKLFVNFDEIFVKNLTKMFNEIIKERHANEEKN